MSLPIDCLQIELTNKCQLDCAECPRRLMTRPVGDMDFELAKLCAREAHSTNGSVNFNVNGLGDPILYPHLGDYFRFLSELQPNCHVSFFTNLSVPKEKVRTLFETVRTLPIRMLVATTKHVYDGKGANAAPVSRFYDEALATAAEVLAHTPNVELHSHMVINKFHSDPDIEAFFEYFRKILHPDRVHISKQLNPWLDLVIDMAGKEGFDAGHMKRPESGEATCFYPFKTCHIGWDGEMIICCTDDVNAECSFGKVKEPGDLTRLWNGPALEAIRAEFNNLFGGDITNAPAPCQKCHLLKWMNN